MIEITPAQADTLMALGSLIGLFVKGYALKDSDTVWSRKSSGLNVLSYPLTALLPMAVLGIWKTFTLSVVTYMIWTGIYLFRAPDNEDLFGRKS